jgi:hypothetical protein
MKATRLASFALGLCAGVISGVILAPRIVGSFAKSSHRVLVRYPDPWPASEYRNCYLIRPGGILADMARAKGAVIVGNDLKETASQFPDLNCQIGNSNDWKTLVMDVTFSGRFRVPVDRNRPWFENENAPGRRWTCQSSSPGSGELTCKGWE